jgi:hypothetical protein
MNNFRTIIVILVSVIQTSGMLASLSCDSSKLTEFAGKVCKNVKSETSAKIVESAYDVRANINEGLQDLNSTICRKEATLKIAEKPVVSSGKSADLPVKKASGENQQPVKRNSVMTQIIFDSTVNADLF